MKNSLFLGTVLTTLLIAGAASADTQKFIAQLDGASEQPDPTNSTAHGKASFTFDTVTNKFCGRVDYTATGGGADALGSALTLAHIHMVTAEDGTGGPIIPLTVGATPIVFGATLTTDQVTGLMDGKLYANLHTTNFPNGEIRGDIGPDTDNDGDPVTCPAETTTDGGTGDAGSGTTTPPGTTPPGATPPATATGDAGTTPATSTSDDGCSTTGSAPTSGIAIALGVGVAIAAMKRRKKK